MLRDRLFDTGKEMSLKVQMVLVAVLFVVFAGLNIAARAPRSRPFRRRRRPAGVPRSTGFCEPGFDTNAPVDETIHAMPLWRRPLVLLATIAIAVTIAVISVVLTLV